MRRYVLEGKRRGSGKFDEFSFLIKASLLKKGKGGSFFFFFGFMIDDSFVVVTFGGIF